MNMTSYVKPQKRRPIATPSDQEDRATATSNTHQSFGEVRPHGFRVMRADRQTDRYTNKETDS